MAATKNQIGDVDDSLLVLARTGQLPAGTLADSELLLRARDHRMSALVHHAVQNQQLAGDEEVLQVLAADALRAAGRSRMAVDALGRLVELADGEFQIGIAKGVAFDLSLYEEREVREFADLDIFLRHEELPRFGQHLKTFGDTEIEVELLNTVASSGRTYEHSVRIDQIAVDVHNDIMNFLLPVRQHELFWSRLVPLPEVVTSRNGVSLAPVLVLDAELALIQALVNYSRDLFTDLRHLNDFRVMLARDIDWDFVAAFSTEEGWYDIVASSLDVVCGYLQIPSPLPIRSRFSHTLATRVLWPERRRLQGRSVIAGIRTGQARASLLIRGRRLEVLRELVRRVLPPTEILELLGYGDSGPRLWRMARYRWNQAKLLRSRRGRMLY